MRVVNDMVNFDKGALQKLEAHLTDVQKNFMGSLRHETVQTALQKLEIQARDAHFGYRSIFESAFKNLEDHVKDVQNSHRNKFRRDNFQKLYRAPTVAHVTVVDPMPPLLSRNDLDPRSYQDGLCSSLKVFQIRKWRPMTSFDRSQVTSTRSWSDVDRPKTSPATSCGRLHERPGPQPQSKHNPKDVLGSTLLFPRKPSTPRLEVTNLEALGRRAFSDLVRDPRTLTARSTSTEAAQQFTPEEMLTERHKHTPHVLQVEPSTSGIDSDGPNSDGPNSEADVKYADDIDNDSGLELRKEGVPPVCLDTKLLNLDRRLKEQVQTPENKTEDTLGDLSYSFRCPLPSPLDTVDLCLCAKENRDWRQEHEVAGALDPLVGSMFDRLVELEKLQIETREWEDRRMRWMRKRSASRSSSKPRDKQCSDPGVQSTSAGDCPNKILDGNCFDKFIHQQCTDTSRDTRPQTRPRCCDKFIHQQCTDASRDPRPQTRPRQTGEESKQLTHSRTSPSQNNNFCQKRNTPVFITVNGVSPARPKSAIFKLNRSRISSKTKDQRPVSACTIPGRLFKITDKLGLDPFPAKPPSNVTYPQPNNIFK